MMKPHNGPRMRAEPRNSIPYVTRQILQNILEKRQPVVKHAEIVQHGAVA